EVRLGGHAIRHRVVVRADVDRDDVRALFREPDRVAAALAAARAGHEGDLACYSSCHDVDCSPYLIIAPASTGSVTPVMYLASSEARKRIALLMSTGSTQGIGRTFSVLNAVSAVSLVGFG